MQRYAPENGLLFSEKQAYLIRRPQPIALQWSAPSDCTSTSSLAHARSFAARARTRSEPGVAHPRRPTSRATHASQRLTRALYVTSCDQIEVGLTHALERAA